MTPPVVALRWRALRPGDGWHLPVGRDLLWAKESLEPGARVALSWEDFGTWSTSCVPGIPVPSAIRGIRALLASLPPAPPWWTVLIQWRWRSEALDLAVAARIRPLGGRSTFPPDWFPEEPWMSAMGVLAS